MSSPRKVSPDNCAREHTLRVADLCLTYGRTPALREITFNVQCGDSLALLGPNGAGKSTLLKSLAGLLRPDHGQILWRGNVLTKGSHEIAYLPQRSEIDWNFPATVRRIVEMGRYPHLGWWRPFKKSDALAVDRAIEQMELSDLQHRQINALSGGQQQRTFLARALAQEAHVFLLDEPFTGLDVQSASSLADHFASLTADGHLIIASHHNLESAPRIFDHALLLKKKVLAFGPCSECITEDLRREAFHSEVRIEEDPAHVA